MLLSGYTFDVFCVHAKAHGNAQTSGRKTDSSSMYFWKEGSAAAPAPPTPKRHV